MGQYDEGLENEGGGEDQVVAARELGWVPQDEFKGDPDKWVDADEFMDRAEKLMPILRANNKRLSRSLLTRTREIDTLKAQLGNATQSIAKLEKHYSDANRRAVENAKRELTDSLKQAREDNDVDAEIEIQEKLAELRASQSTPDKKEEPAPASPKAEVDPEFQEWAEDNDDWFGPDKKKTKAVLRIAEDLREEGETATGREFLDKCVSVYEEQQAPSSRRTPSKVESGGNAPRSGSGGKSWADLPKEAQQTCLADVETFVGEGKLYKTEAEWKKHYVSIYFSE